MGCKKAAWLPCRKEETARVLWIQMGERQVQGQAPQTDQGSWCRANRPPASLRQGAGSSLPQSHPLNTRVQGSSISHSGTTQDICKYGMPSTENVITTPAYVCSVCNCTTPFQFLCFAPVIAECRGFCCVPRISDCKAIARKMAKLGVNGCEKGVDFAPRVMSRCLPMCDGLDAHFKAFQHFVGGSDRISDHDSIGSDGKDPTGCLAVYGCLWLKRKFQKFSRDIAGSSTHSPAFDRALRDANVLRRTYCFCFSMAVFIQHKSGTFGATNDRKFGPQLTTTLCHSSCVTERPM